MRFWLFFTAVAGLAAWWIASAAPVQAPFSVTVVPAGSIAPPAPAVAAGFTSPLWYADFTTSTGTNFVTGGAGHTVNWSTLSNWLAECGGPAFPTPSWHWVGDNFIARPCNTIDIENDSLVGKNVLHISSGSTRAYLTFPYVIFGPGTGVGSHIFPVEYYFEVTWRTNSATINQSGVHDIIQSFGSVGQGHALWIEPDHFEWFIGQNNGLGQQHYGDGTTEYLCSTPVTGFCPGSIFPPAIVTNLYADFSAYHKIGVLFTGNVTDQYWKCAYQDDVLQGCNQMTFTQGGTEAVDDLNNTDYVHGVLLNFPTDSVPADAYIQKIQLWACANSYLTGNSCQGPVINSPPH